MLGIFLILLILFLIGLPFYWLYKLIFKKKKINVSKEPKITENKSETKVSDLITERKFLFMEDYRMWKGLSDSERKDRLKDIQVIFDYGKDHITKAMIKKGFQPGSKIIDIKYFTGLNPDYAIENGNGGLKSSVLSKICSKKCLRFPSADSFILFFRPSLTR